MTDDIETTLKEEDGMLSVEVTASRSTETEEPVRQSNE